MDKLKTYFVEVIVKKVGPRVSAALISVALTFLAAHQELMQQMGITYYPDFSGKWFGAMPTGRVLVMEIDTLGIWGGAALVTLVMAAVAFFQHHTVATVTGAPQSGDKRAVDSPPMEGGKREGDPK